MVLATLPAITGATVSRLRGAPVARTALTSVVILAVALGIVAIEVAVDR